MRDGHSIAVVIPARNEAASIGRVLGAIPSWVDDIVVADNGSIDATAETARGHGARVVFEPRKGYGSACLRGIAALRRPDIVVFLDADYSDHPEEMPGLVDPIIADEADFVVGSRVRGEREPGALTPQARFGNRLACFLMRSIWRVNYSDLGPFRAIRFRTLMQLDMRDPDYGWTVEMQIKAAVHDVRSIEVPVRYRKRIGRSKVSGTIRGVLGAGYKILGHIFVGALMQVAGASKPKAPIAVIVFSRYPEPGMTKTRMIPALGPEGAADLQRRMTEHTVASMAAVPGNIHHIIRFTGGDEGAMRGWLGDDIHFLPQGEGDLGERMARAFEEAFDSGHDRAVIVGSDCPDVSTGIVRAALRRLDSRDLVLGPATDGGYYLIALRASARHAAVPHLFAEVEWGGDTVFAETVKRAAARTIRLATLAPLDDVDRPEDLPVWNRHEEVSKSPSPAVSVIIPALNEEHRIARALERASACPDTEVIVVDGGSSDKTVEVAERCGAIGHGTIPGRAHQMNFGSAKAAGDVLLFLHADTYLPDNFVKHVTDTLATGAIAGAFRFSTDEPSRTMRWIAWWTNLRTQWLRKPYGDQAIFIRKDVFRELGGYRELPIMEDFDLVCRLGRRGPVRIAPVAVMTSGRRWNRLGPWRTMMRNQFIVAGWYLGVSPQRLAAYYHWGRNGNRDDSRR